MARSVLRQPRRLGIILSVLPVLVIGLFSLQSLMSGPSGDDGQNSAGVVSATSGSPSINTPDIPTGNPAGQISSPNNPGAVATDGDFTGIAAYESGYVSQFLADLISPASQDSPPGQQPGNPGPPSPLPAGDLSGYVWQEDIMDGPLGNITIFLADANGDFKGVSVRTDPGGSFNFLKVPAGLYKLYIFDGGGLYRAGWYGDADIPQGKVVGVSAGAHSFISYKLSAAKKSDYGSISGRVTSPALGDGVRKTEVFAYLISSDGSMSMVSQVTTDDGGYYEIAELISTDSANGQDKANLGYKIKFIPPSESGFAPQWYKNQLTMEGAKVISLKSGEAVNNIDAQLAGGGTISGSVTMDGTPSAFASVKIFDASGVMVNSIKTDASGSFQSGVLAPAAYKVYAQDAGMQADEWYQDKKDLASANAVAVNANQDTGGINITIRMDSMAALAVLKVWDCLILRQTLTSKKIPGRPAGRWPDLINFCRWESLLRAMRYIWAKLFWAPWRRHC